jgi:hypothetical protein
MAKQHIICRAHEFQHLNGRTPDDAAHQCLQQEMGEHEAMLNLFFGVYNFCKVHGTLKTTPAVAAGLTDHVWTVCELLENTELPHRNF